MSVSGNDVGGVNLGRSGRSLSDSSIEVFTTLSDTYDGVVLDYLLSKGVTMPQVEILVQFPDPNDRLRQLSAMGLDGLTTVTIVRDEDMTANTLDFAIANGDGRYTPSL